jgi:hypothetical protein
MLNSWPWLELGGGTELPDVKFMAVAGVVLSAGFYAWFIHDDSPLINRTK